MTKRTRLKVRKLAREIAKLEGRKHQASFGDIEEILHDIVLIEAKKIQANKRCESYPTYILCEYATDVVRKLKKKK